MLTTKPQPGKLAVSALTFPQHPCGEMPPPLDSPAFPTAVVQTEARQHFYAIRVAVRATGDCSHVLRSLRSEGL